VQLSVDQVNFGGTNCVIVIHIYCYFVDILLCSGDIDSFVALVDVSGIVSSAAARAVIVDVLTDDVIVL
jgi:hypothetical protein